MALQPLTANALPGRRVGPPEALESKLLGEVVGSALREDLGTGDCTSASTVPSAARARGSLVAKEGGVLAGLAVFEAVFRTLDPHAQVASLAADGESFESGAVLARVEGGARALLSGERTALNFVQRLSGIASLTARYVAAAHPVRVLDTRKTTPGLRVLERYAVRCGGGENHRFGLFDEVMIKNNHVDLAGRPLDELVVAARDAVGPSVRITAEARDAAEAEAAVRGGADVVLLDNMTPAELSALCPRLRALGAEGSRTVELEASGGITLENLASIAQSGVDRVSIGALTHSAAALDLSFRLELLA